MMQTKKRWQFALLIALLLGWDCMSAATTSAAARESTETINYEAGFYYTVKSGDTLWGLSQQFNDTPWQWPDLWQENDQIANPHWIYPGERIRLFRKKDQHRVQAPQKDVVAAPEAPIVAPPPVEQPRPEVYYWNSNIDRLGFIRKPAATPLGTIFKSRDDKTLISKGDMVYIRSESEKGKELSPGMRLTIYRTMSPTKDRNAEQVIGTQHLLVGIAEVAKKESGYSLAKILQSYQVIHIDDLVMPYHPGDPQIMLVDSVPGIEGNIIIGEDHTQFMGEHFIAFIDKGRQDHLLPGQIYSIYLQEKDKRVGLLEKVDIGSLIVLRTEETTSTVIITDSARQILPGQPFRTPQQSQ